MKCPTRRGGYAFSDVPSNTFDSGPQTDYAVLYYRRDTAVAAGKTTIANEKQLTMMYNPADSSSQFFGPLRWAANVPNDDSIDKWKPAVDFSYWQDGTTNQLLFGEKHIPGKKSPC